MPGSFWCATARCIAKAFAASPAYLRKELRGLAAGSPWPCDYGPDLSRGFRALKTWFTLKVHGTQALGSVISRLCALARYLESRIAETPELELLAPVELNVVCFRYRAQDAQRVNAQIVVELQESGAVAPSTTTLGGRLAIRAALVNHRTGTKEIDLLVEKTGGPGTGHRNQRRPRRPKPRAAATGRGLAATTRARGCPALSQRPHRVRSGFREPAI